MNTKRKDIPIEDQLAAAELALDCALNDPEILAALAEYNYDEARLQIGQLLYQAAFDAQRQQQERYSDQFAATAAFNESFERARKAFNQVRQLARLAAQANPDLPFEKLQLSGRSEQGFGAWLVQARIFYEAALGDPVIQIRLADYGVTQLKIQAGLEATNMVEALNVDQEHKKGGAQAATKARDMTLAELNQWMKAFRQVAAIALEDKPEKLEALGFSS